MGVGDRIVLVAPAKVNLYLEVGPRRIDGYHDVVTVMQALELHDTVTVEPGSRLSVVCEPDLGVPPCDNLVAAAARIIGRLLDREPNVAIGIRKRIPAGGGLGGGSADAAAAIVGLATLWGLPLSDPRVRQAAEAVGADAPFFLDGGCALMGGRGAAPLRRLPVPRLHIALVNPGVEISTAAAYAAFDRLPTPRTVGPEAMMAAVESGDPAAVAAALHDDLTEAAVGLAPEVGEALASLGDAPGLLGAGMTGSGSSAFGVFATGEAASGAVDVARARGWWAAVTGTRDGGASPAVGAERDTEEGS